VQSLQESPEIPLARVDRLVDRASSTTWDWYDTRLVVVGAIATIFVHPVHAMLSRPYWFDEAWVAALTRAPLSRLPHLGAGVPVGFVALLKLVPGTGLQRARLVPLAFAVLSVVTAYALTRSLPGMTRASARFGAIVAALLVMLAPLSLHRNDLKQYTCDAFCALGLLAIGAWAERAPRRSRLLWLAGAAIVAIPFSSTSAFVSVAMFAGLLAAALIARSARRAVDVVIAGAIAAVGVGAYMGLVVAPTLNPKLKAYWASQYLSGSPLQAVTATWNRLARLTTELAMPLPLFILLFLTGIVVLVKLRAHALAFAVPFLWIEMAAAGRLRRYPYLDLRTSHFLFVVSLVVVAIGAVGILRLIWGARNVFRGDYGAWIAVIVGGAMAGLFTMGFAREVDKLAIPKENVRAETLAVAERRKPRDLVLVSFAARFGFSYYWPHGSIVFKEDASGQGFRPEVSDVPVTYARGRTYEQVQPALSAAVERWRAAGGDSRLFIVRTHLDAEEIYAWRRAFRELDLHPHADPVGSDLLLILEPS
jgi:hypothetical protein